MSSKEQVVLQMLECDMPQLPAGHPVLDGKFHRFGPKKKAWYVLRELPLSSGRSVITGAFGFNQGENHNTVPVKIDAEALSTEDRAEYVRQQRKAEEAEEERRAEAARLAAGRARDQWIKAEHVPVEHPYLARKQIPAEGLRVGLDGRLLIPLVRNGQMMGLQKIDAAGVKLLNKGMDAIGVAHVLGTLAGAPVIAVGEGYATCASARLSLAPGYDLPAVVALNAGNLIHVAKALRQRYPHAHLLMLADDDYLLAERFVEFLQESFKVVVHVPIDGATHRVTNDDGELVEVTAWWRKDAQGVEYIATDVRKGRRHSAPKFTNAGVASCHVAAAAVGNASVACPLFSIDRAGRKITDFNDLHVEEGLDAVTAQMGAFLLAAQQRISFPPAPTPAPAAAYDPQPGNVLPFAAKQSNIDSPPSPHAEAADVQSSASPVPPAAEQPSESPIGAMPQDFEERFGEDSTQGRGPAGDASRAGAGDGDQGDDQDEEDEKPAKDKPKKVYGRDHWDKVDDVLENFILVYGEDMVWDCRHRMLMRLSAMRTIVANSDVMKFWSGDARKWVLKKNIVFDPKMTPSPAVSGPTATVNLFNGWPMKPKKGDCLQIRTLLYHLCNGDAELETWISRWLAYPLRNPGAKMQTSIIMHGDEGSGKNFFFEGVVKAIYGEYGYVIGNDQLESKFNDWASMKLFMVADEVVTRAELKQMKGKLKGLVTGDTVIVNPKGMPEHVEKNQMNFVFLSNELQPLALDKTDRRYLVVWTPPALDREFYLGVDREIQQGGIEAFYHYLMYELDMGDFTAHTKPIYNDAKDSLIEKSLAPAERFYREWSRGYLPLPFITVSVNQLYDAFKVWCARSGEPMYTSMTAFSPMVARYAGDTMRKHLIKYELGSKVKQRMVFLVGDQPAGKSLAEWAEGSSALFETDLRSYRSRYGANVDSEP